MPGSSTPCATRSIPASRVSQNSLHDGQAFSYDLAELGRYYRWYHELMDHWRSVLPAGAMLDVSYEEVVDNLEEQARRLIDFCGLPWDDRCLSFHETSRPIKTASNVQVRQPLYRSSVDAGAATKHISSRCWSSSKAAAGCDSCRRGYKLQLVILGRHSIHIHPKHERGIPLGGPSFARRVVVRSDRLKSGVSRQRATKDP